jgi:hypothetical protein
VGLVRELRADALSDVVRAERDQAKTNLNAANAKLDEMGVELRRTREQLRQQANLSLITSFAQGTVIHEGSWWLHMGRGGSGAQNIVDYLASAIPPAYREVARVKLQFSPFMGINSHIALTPGLEGAKVTDDGRGSVVRYPSRGVATSPSPELVLPNVLARDPMLRAVFASKTNADSRIIVMQKVGTGERQRSAAIAYRDLTRRRAVASITVEFRKMFKAAADRNSFLWKNPKLRGVRGWISSEGLEVEFEIPRELRRQIEAYWKSTITGASSNLYLYGDSYLMLENALEMGPVQAADSNLTLPFFNKGDPEVSVAIEEI